MSASIAGATDIQPAARDNHRMVLVVDDHEDVANGFLIALRDEGIDARAVYSARAAREAIQRLAPKLVVLGDYLRDMGDVELLTDIRNTGGCELIPILYHTTSKTADGTPAASQPATAGVFTKGACSVKEVVAHIKTLLNHAAV